MHLPRPVGYGAATQHASTHARALHMHTTGRACFALVPGGVLHALAVFRPRIIKQHTLHATALRIAQPLRSGTTTHRRATHHLHLPATTHAHRMHARTHGSTAASNQTPVDSAGIAASQQSTRDVPARSPNAATTFHAPPISKPAASCTAQPRRAQLKSGPTKRAVSQLRPRPRPHTTPSATAAGDRFHRKLSHHQ